jgi:hypothetical protein
MTVRAIAMNTGDQAVNATLSSAPERTAVLHWIARLAAIGMFGFFMLFAIAQGIPPLAAQPPRVQLEFASLAIIFVGYAIGWRRPFLGGVTALFGYGMLNAVEFATNHRSAGGAFWLFAIPGILYLIAAWRSSQRIASPNS